MHMDFLTGLNDKMLIISNQESADFIQANIDLFSELQDEFLKLLNKELSFYQNELSESGNQQKQNAKDLVNPDILKNMIEILNTQILLKLTGRMFSTQKDSS